MPPARAVGGDTAVGAGDRGRPPKADGEKKAPKRKAEPAVDEDGNPLQKKGRGRPPGGGKKKAAKEKPAKGVSHLALVS